MSEWQPIETAPITRDPYLVWCPSIPAIALVIWDDVGTGDWWIHPDNADKETSLMFDLDAKPTHWMPLPEPPKAIAREAGR